MTKRRTEAGADAPAPAPLTQAQIFQQVHAQGWNIEHSRVYRNGTAVERIVITDGGATGAIWLEGEGADFDEAFLYVAANIEHAMQRLIGISETFAAIINAALAAQEAA